jgi:nucleoside recognition membrane protein YjiH
MQNWFMYSFIISLCFLVCISYSRQRLLPAAELQETKLRILEVIIQVTVSYNAYFHSLKTFLVTQLNILQPIWFTEGQSPH